MNKVAVPETIVIEEKITRTIRLDIPAVATWFCALTDDQQARFFVVVAEQAKSWPLPQSYQRYQLGSHLRNCTCSSEEARDMIREIMNGLKTGKH